MQQNIEQLQLQPIDFNRFATQNVLLEKKYNLTKHNPFTTMNNDEWKHYVETHKPHFTCEPYYELIPWNILQQLEIDAKAAGWELILRTTNNTVYCPGHVNQNWCQRTQWIFGLPNQQLLIHLTYNEDKWSLVKDDNDIPLRNYFCVNVIGTTKLKAREKPDDELDDDFDYNYDYQGNYSSKVKYYELFKPPNGWIPNGGTNYEGTSQFEYIYVGPDSKYNTFLKKKYFKNILEEMFPYTFWIEWIENNKNNIEYGKFNKVLITNWSDTHVFPGGQFKIDEILKWDMNFQFLQKLINSNIKNWITDIYGYECCETIGYLYWNFDLIKPLLDNPELLKKTCILEVQKLNDIDVSNNKNNYWKPFNGYKNSIFNNKNIRLSANAQTLIKQVWEYVNLQNQ